MKNDNDTTLLMEKYKTITEAENKTLEVTAAELAAKRMKDPVQWEKDYEEMFEPDYFSKRATEDEKTGSKGKIIGDAKLHIVNAIRSFQKLILFLRNDVNLRKSIKIDLIQKDLNELNSILNKLYILQNSVAEIGDMVEVKSGIFKGRHGKISWIGSDTYSIEPEPSPHFLVDKDDVHLLTSYQSWKRVRRGVSRERQYMRSATPEEAAKMWKYPKE